MITVDEAHAAITGSLAPLPHETVPITEGAGRILAEPVVAQLTQPPFNASAMDGYAVRLRDVVRERANLRVCGVSSAGERYHQALPDECAVRIFTGAPVPKGADHVIIQEHVEADGDTITVRRPAERHGNIRRAGIDFNQGDTLLEAGRRLGGRDIGLAAAANNTSFTVRRQPRVALVANGDELVLPGENLGPDQIVCSIPYALEPMIKAWGGVPAFLGIARDDLQDLRRFVDEAREYDLIVPIGGASVGDRDFMRTAFHEAGFQSIFQKVAVKPGKPTWFGKLGDHAVLGLPGNPASALVMAILFMKPALAVLSGAMAQVNPFHQGTTSTAITKNGSRETYLRARIVSSSETNACLEALQNQDSALLSVMSAANALIRRPANAPALAPGDTVDYVSIA